MADSGGSMVIITFLDEEKTMKAVKIFNGMVLMALGALAVAIVCGVDINIHRDGHISVKAWEHQGQVLINIEEESSEASYLPGRWERVEEENNDNSDVSVENSDPEGSSVGTIKIKMIIEGGIEDARIIFPLKDVTLYPEQETELDFIFQIPESCNGEPFQVQYKKDGKWFFLKTEGYWENQSPHLHGDLGDKFRKYYDERRKEKIRKIEM